MLDVSVVVVSYNQADYLAKCLDTVNQEFSDDGYQGRLVVVDNASQEPCGEVARAKGAHFIQNLENRGFASACNQGIDAYPSRYVLLLNNDVFLQKGVIQALMDYADAHPKVGAVTPRLLSLDGREQMPPLFRFRPCSRKWIPCACLLVRRDVLDRLGGLDEGFFFYNEDVDLGIRLRRAGYRLIYHPALSVIHCEGKSTDGVRPMTVLEGYRGGLRLMGKHYGALALRLTRLGMRLEIQLLKRLIGFKKRHSVKLTSRESALNAIYPELVELVRNYQP